MNICYWLISTYYFKEFGHQKWEEALDKTYSDTGICSELWFTGEACEQC
jgi:hypothetical protein